MPEIDTQLTDDERMLLSKVPDNGGTIGNITLRKSLAWDASKYVPIKKSLISKGILQPGGGMGGSVSRVPTRPRGTDQSRGTRTDNTGQEEQATITRKQRSTLSKILFDSLPKDGSLATNRAVLQKVQEVAKARLGLEVSKETYFEIRKELIAVGRVGKGVGYGGRVYRIEGAALAAKAAKRHRIPEAKLYEAVGKYIEQTWTDDNEIEEFILDKTASGRGKKAGGKWTRPDFALVAIQKFIYIPGITIELVTFEVKPADDFRIEGVFETAAHSRPAHRSYLMIHTPDGKPNTETFERLVEECERFDLGLIIFRTPDDLDSFETVLEAKRRNPNPADVNGFIADRIGRQNQDKISKMVR